MMMPPNNTTPAEQHATMQRNSHTRACCHKSRLLPQLGLRSLCRHAEAAAVFAPHLQPIAILNSGTAASSRPQQKFRSLKTNMTNVVLVSTCSLNQWALDFSGNLERIHESVIRCKRQGARYRMGPELELCGYGCEDHYFENDTITHSWESLVRLLEMGDSDDLLLDVGLPVMHKGARYNVRVFCLNRKIVLVRPKTVLADDGNYRESRWFTPWPWGRAIDEFVLPVFVGAKLGQRSCPFGVAILQLDDASIACEMCEELWAPHSPHIEFALNGVDIIGNASGSHHQLRKLGIRMELMRSASHKCGGIYMYANQFGCDGGRLYFDGSPLIVVNGDCVAQGEQFGIHDVQVCRLVCSFLVYFIYAISPSTAGLDRWCGS